MSFMWRMQLRQYVADMIWYKWFINHMMLELGMILCFFVLP